MMECVWWPVPVGVHQFAALRNDLVPECFLFVFSANPNMLSLHWEEKQRGPDGSYRETNSCRYCGAVLCMHGHGREGILEDQFTVFRQLVICHRMSSSKTVLH